MNKQPAENSLPVRSNLQSQIASLEGLDQGDERYWEEVVRLCTDSMASCIGTSRAMKILACATEHLPIPQQHEFPVELYRDVESGLFRASFFAAEYPRYGRGVNALVLIRFDPPADPTAGVNEFAVRMGALIADSIRTVDVGCRWSANEFLILLPRTSVEQALIVARRIHDSRTIQGFPKGSISVAIAAAENAEPIGDVYGRASWSVYDAQVTGNDEISIA